ncbi:hypothetical protein PBRA_002627 [Plasmodiophora brassicae]|uniref:Uncharacterized protein n=1 Tax=Plasmodiophora brassicae TaxID=37360 RepID=A0A0G4J541_PLABS|nr:hypothetical protein PBRA_002627 [Plasmodiophora brassicae]
MASRLLGVSSVWGRMQATFTPSSDSTRHLTCRNLLSAQTGVRSSIAHTLPGSEWNSWTYRIWNGDEKRRKRGSIADTHASMAGVGYRQGRAPVSISRLPGSSEWLATCAATSALAVLMLNMAMAFFRTSFLWIAPPTQAPATCTTAFTPGRPSSICSACSAGVWHLLSTISTSAPLPARTSAEVTCHPTFWNVLMTAPPNDPAPPTCTQSASAHATRPAPISYNKRPLNRYHGGSYSPMQPPGVDERIASRQIDVQLPVHHRQTALLVALLFVFSSRYRSVPLSSRSRVLLCAFVLMNGLDTHGGGNASGPALYSQTLHAHTHTMNHCDLSVVSGGMRPVPIPDVDGRWTLCSCPLPECCALRAR